MSIAENLNAKRLVVCVLLAAVAITLPGRAEAGLGGKRLSTVAATAAKWAVVDVAQGAAATTGAFAVNWSVDKGNAYAFMDSVNTGTMSVSAETYSFTTVATQNGNQKTPTVTLDACVGGSWAASTNTCSGTITRMGSAVSGSFVAAVPLRAGERLSVRVLSDGPPGASFLTTISVAVARSQVRAGTTTNS